MFGSDRRFPVTGSRACERLAEIREVHSLVGHFAVSIVRGLRALAGLEPLAWWGVQTVHALTSIALRIDRLPEPIAGAEPRSVPSPAIRAWAEGVHPGWDPGYRERVQLALRGLVDALEAALAGRELSPIDAEYLARARADASEAGKIARWLAPLDLGVQAAARHLHQEESAAARAIAARAVSLGACPADPMLWWVVPPGVPGGLHGGPHVLHRLERALERPEGAIGEGSWTADGGGQAAREADIAALATTDDLAWAQRALAEAPHLSCGRTLAESLRAAALDAVVRLTRS